MNESSLTLPEVLDAQIDCATRLITVLDDEHAALTGRSIEALEAACDAKAAAAQTLQRLGDRLQILAGPRRSGAEFEAWLARHPGGQTLIEGWRKLTALAQNLADSNRRNGVLLDVREQQVKRALVALSPEPPSIYGRSGYRPDLPPGRVHSRA
ncbi:flagella synthesis protein FlgN [Nevskia sp.]|uniref:flagella synthesis protein FlgN n=1 Tax=Nevskia sp. TaxID=1929292 RepID=UPI0025FFB78B|nr:flagellar protein FlgN [Nevskia sp.]